MKEELFRLTRRQALAGIAGLSLLATPGQSLAQSEASDAEVVRIGVVKVAGHVDIYAAQKLGYFKDEGLNVETTIVRSGTEAQAAAVAGRLEFLGLNIVSFVYGLHEGFEFKAAADGFRAPLAPPGTSAVLIRDDGTINSPKDLEGKTLGLVGHKGLNDLYFQLWARKNNVDTTTMKIIEVPYPQMLDVVINKQMDAVLPLEPIVTRGIAEGKLKALSFYDTEVEPGHSNSLWVGMGGWMDKHPVATRKFRSAVYKAHEALTNDPALARELIAEWTELSPELVDKMGRDVFATDFPVESMNGIVANMRELGWIQNEVKIEDGLF